MGMNERQAARELTDAIAQSDRELTNALTLIDIADLFYNCTAMMPSRARQAGEELIEELRWDEDGTHKNTIVDIRWAVQRIAETSSVSSVLTEYRDDRRAAFGGEGAPEFV